MSTTGVAEEGSSDKSSDGEEGGGRDGRKRGGEAEVEEERGPLKGVALALANVRKRVRGAPQERK